MLTLLLPMVVWVSFGMLMTRRLLAAPAVGLIAWLFVASGPLLGVAYALRIIAAGDVDADALQGWLAGLGIGGLILALGVRQQAAALHRLEPARRRLLEIGMLWLASLAGGLLGFVFAGAMVLAFGAGT
jgi:hypothetical protein